MRRVFGVYAAAFLLLGGCGHSLTSVPSNLPPGPTANLQVSILVASPNAAITTATLTLTPNDGAAPVTGSSACAAAGCTANIAAPISGSTLLVDLKDAQSQVLHSGALHVVVQRTGTAVGVTFGGTPAVIRASANPGSFTDGTAATSVVRALVYDAQGNRMIGAIAFPSPITMSSSDTSGKIALTGSTIAKPGDTLTLSYTGSGTARTTLTPSSAIGTPVTATVAAVPPPHQTIDGNINGDLNQPSQEDRDAVPTAPPIPPPMVVTAIRPLANPASADLSAQMPPVGNQGAENSCVGWASGYAIQSYLVAQKQKWPLGGGVGPNGININHVFSPAYIYNQINGGKDNGSTFSVAFSLLEKQGVAPWSFFPYVAKQFLTQPSQAAITAAAPYTIKTYYSIPTTTAGITQAKSYLAQGYPLFWGTELDNIFEAGKFTILNGAFGTDTGGHAMTIVGYDDSMQAFKVLNSWGTNWENSGYFWVSYSWVLNNPVMSDIYVLMDP